MNLYWGDLHNHCGITYGFGSLKNAIARAEEHLDFCAFTGHAMWPDMMERTEETAFTVDFHREGFKKLKENWEKVRAEIAKANGKDFVTFQGYEMHSSEYGDHHLISPDDSLPLVYKQSPAELLEKCGCKGIVIPHHIGYTPGYRGINWAKHDEEISPVVEVISKHGCAMDETAPYPYYHDMGPRDSRNLAAVGLAQGKHFGFVGSTDHHAGYPGSYGDGKLAVIAKEKTRESIFEAIRQRHVYAVSGDRIVCNFKVNGALMGSVLKTSAEPRDISFGVRACYPIDKIVIYKNYKPIHIMEGLLLDKQQNAGKYKIRIEMGWGNNKEEAFRWDGSLQLENGALQGVEKCFRGRSVLSPTSGKPINEDEVNNLDNHVDYSDKKAEWRCYTLQNQTTLHPQTSALIFEVEGDKNTALTITMNGVKTSLTLKQLCQSGYSAHVKPFHSQAYKVHPAIPETQYDVTGEVQDKICGENDYYHMQVNQRNNQYAFVSPVFFEK